MTRPIRRTAIIAQAGLLLALAAFGLSLAHNVSTNLGTSNIRLGFGFLGEASGFAISQSLIPFTEQSTYGRVLLVGLLNTLVVAATGIVLATVLGFAIGLARLSRNWLIARAAGLYVEVVRNIPLLLQLFVWYFAVLRPLPRPREALSLGGIAFLHNRGLQLPAFDVGAATLPVLIGLAAGIVAAIALRRSLQKRRVLLLQIALILGLPFLAWLLSGAHFTYSLPQLTRFNFTGGIVVRPEFLALLIALSTYTASYIAETVRGGVLAVPRGQSEAATALGLSRAQALRLVILPQALRVIIPPLTSQYLNLTKNSSLAIAIGYPELVSVFAGTALNQSGHAIEIIAITMGVYLAISLLTSFAMNRYNARLARQGA